MSNFKYFLEAYSLSTICKIVLEYTLKFSQLISSSDNKKILLRTRNIRLDSGRYATKYYYVIFPFKKRYLLSFTACYGPYFIHRKKRRPLLDKLSGPIAIVRAQKSLSMKFKDNLKLLYTRCGRVVTDFLHHPKFRKNLIS